MTALDVARARVTATERMLHALEKAISHAESSSQSFTDDQLRAPEMQVNTACALAYLSSLSYTRRRVLAALEEAKEQAREAWLQEQGGKS